MTPKLSFKTAASTVALLLLTQNAFALDANDFAAKLKAIVEVAGQEISFNDARAEGDTITLDGISMPVAGEDPFTLQAQVVFSGVREANGGYMVDKAVFGDIVVVNDEAGFTLNNLEFDTLTIPGSDFENPVNMANFYRGMSMGPISIQSAGQDVATIASVTATSVLQDDKVTFDSNYEVTGIHADLSKIDEAEIQGVLAMFGLQEINASARGHASWNIETGSMVVSESKLDITDIASINFTSDLSGYSAKFLAGLQERQQKLTQAREAADADDAPTEAADALTTASEEMLDYMVKSLTLNHASFRFEDDSITNKILDFAATMQGMPREALTAGTAGMISIMAAEIGAPEKLQAMLAKAATTFLADPQSLEVVAAPAQPVLFDDLGKASDDPSALMDLLGLSVTANQ